MCDWKTKVCLVVGLLLALAISGPVVAGLKSEENGATDSPLLARVRGDCASGRSAAAIDVSWPSLAGGMIRAGLADPSPCVRQKFVALVGNNGGDEWLDELYIAAGASDSGLRTAATAALGEALGRTRADTLRCADEQFVKRFIELLEDEHPPVRDEAMMALKNLSGMDLGYTPSNWEAWWEDSRFVRVDR